MSTERGIAALGWDRVHAGRIDTVVLSGDHFTIMSGPEELAPALSDRVRRSVA